ncbi:TPA: tellurite resistance domain protein [Yersinia enterocolitica]|uniref:Tellurite resistance protein n=1 Tax=Yersinia enterocolitica TaxID=630 RepID=A0A9P1PRF6_YEREN|nr:tellurite resistance domain protein [Yersinia enterocolitica]EKN3343239.1 tellurite resistance domain protein [Yersinia enterocolitica]EKN3488547.1 tellurite resistance domain protein [Yersinia enterocolitica]EKN3561682.1 tellurite resistance domain protein [Yersinia enterocolitica]EKN3575796.1 tellurite resistance domain protein [Yersinia enterocolitica]EKN3579834.1 tellurite resistance domain protein [Yersinia enterocolitica]
MQRLTRSAPIDNSTLATYEETVAIIHRHLPPSLALLYATARRSAEGNLEWWTERQGLATPQSALSDTEQLKIQSKRQLYQDTVAGLIEQLKARGDAKSAQALQTLLTHSQELTCYSVGGEPVLINWAIPVQESPATVAVAPWQRRFLPWLLLLLLLLLALAWWWFTCHNRPVAVLPVQSETPSAMTNTSPKNTQLTQDNPSINLEKRKDFGRIKVNLTWQQGQHKEPVDLDIAAFVRFKNGKKGGVEALSKLLGNYDKLPFMLLQKDLRGGDDQDGEWLFINGSQWQGIDEVLIYSFIYGGTDNWQGTDATITIYVPGQPPISSMLVNGSELNNVAAIARLKNVDGDLKVERLNSFYRDRQSLDKHYGWGFEWTPGASKN